MALNFGHTLGHALETAAAYSDAYCHGEAVALGMILASEIAVQMDMLRKQDLERIKRIIKNTGLPVCARGVSVPDILKAQQYDKKFMKGTNRFVLPTKIGSVEIVKNVPEKLIEMIVSRYVR